MMRLVPCLALCLTAFVALAALASGAEEIVLPQNRNAFHSREAIEIAVADLPPGAKAVIRLIPADKALRPVAFEVVSPPAGTPVAILPPNTLAPGEYDVAVNDRKPDPAHRLTVSRGAAESTMKVSQTSRGGRQAGANFIVGNAFSFGRLDPSGQPAPVARMRRSMGMEHMENSFKEDMELLIYMYWTGYVTHKPWGINKSWAAPDMVEMMRMFNLHTAQRCRRYSDNILSIGSLDEPGLSWGDTPAGGMASGFPNWDEAGWYRERGWDYTDDPGSRPDADWMKYMTDRCGILGQNFAWAAEDIKTVWPSAVYSTDCYAPHAIMDGTDPWNQRPNDIPSSHVFVDWGWGKLSTLSGVYIEKCHDPASKLAHAMNGQLFGATVPQPQQRDAYRLMMNALLAAGLASNWWLNTRGMEIADLKAVNEPAARVGPVFREMTLAGHDVAVLWSFTEMAMRQKDIAAREAKKKTGEQIKLMVASWPEDSPMTQDDAEMNVNAYSVGRNYLEYVLNTHQALNRAGWPAHIVHERLLPQGVLKNYKVLVVSAQTFELPADVRKAIEDFAASGGKILVDKATAVKLPGAVVVDTQIKDPGYFWGIIFGQAQQEAGGKAPEGKRRFKSVKQASHYQTNYFMDTQARRAVAPLRAAMKALPAQEIVSSDSEWLGCERHTAGEGALYMVINAHEVLPADQPDDKAYWLYNYAPLEVSYALKGLPAGAAVYLIEGPDWKQSSRVADPAAVQTKSFAPGEMKLYLVAPRAPAGLTLGASIADGALSVKAALDGLRMPWPLTVEVAGPDGKPLLTVYRSTGADGAYAETFSLGKNAPAGNYTVTVASPAAELSARTSAALAEAPAAAGIVEDRVRTFDAKAIGAFLAARPALVVPYTGDETKALAEKVAALLNAKGLNAAVRPEKEVWSRARYPRVWDPYIRVHRPGDADKLPDGAKVEQTLTIETGAEGETVARDAAGKTVANWETQPGTLAVVGGQGYIDFGREQFYEPGCKFYVQGEADKQGKVRPRVVLANGRPEKVRTTDEVRMKWSRPWTRLSSYVGSNILCPQLSEAYRCDAHLVLVGTSESGELVRALQASELLPQLADAKYPGPGKALVEMAWSPFALGRNVLFIGASDAAGAEAGAAALAALAP